MKVWLDDIYNPENYGCGDYIWYKNGRTLFHELDDIEDKLTHLHLDHYLTHNLSMFDSVVTGLEIFFAIDSDLEEGKFKNLRYIYIHTSCDDMAETYFKNVDIQELKDKYNVTVIRQPLQH